MIFEVETVLLHALWAKRNAGKGTPAKYRQWGDAAMQLPVPLLRHSKSPAPALAHRAGDLLFLHFRQDGVAHGSAAQAGAALRLIVGGAQALVQHLAHGSLDAVGLG